MNPAIHRLRHKIVLAATTVIAGLVALSPSPGQCASTNTAESLKNAVRGRFDIGVGISDRIPQRPNDWPLLKEQFSFVTPENCMKPNPVQVAEGRFNFSQPDAFVAFAASNCSGSAATAWSGPRMIGPRRGSIATATNRPPKSFSCGA